MSAPPSAHVWYVDVQFFYDDPQSGRGKEGFLRIALSGLEDAMYQADQAAREFLVDLAGDYGWEVAPQPVGTTITAAVLM